MKLYLALNKCGEGVAFTEKREAHMAATGRLGSAYPTLAEAFADAYPDDNRVVEIEVPDAA